MQGFFCLKSYEINYYMLQQTIIIICYSKLEEEKQTIDFEDHDKNKKSFFDCIESSSLKEVDTTNLHSGKKFTIESSVIIN